MKRIITLMGAALVAITAVASAQEASDTTTTKAPPPAPAAAPPPAAASTAVKRAVFCSGVTEREPVDEITTLAAPAERVYFFTEIIGMEGKTVTHRWIHDGTTVSEVPITIGGARWRCYSTKTLSGMTGAWTVEVVDDAGTKIGGASFTYQAAP